MALEYARYCKRRYFCVNRFSRFSEIGQFRVNLNLHFYDFCCFHLVYVFNNVNYAKVCTAQKCLRSQYLTDATIIGLGRWYQTEDPHDFL